MRTYDYTAPASIDEALAALKEYGDEAEFIAGGTSLILMMQQGLVQPGKVIGLGNIKELRGIKRSADGGLEVGAMTTHRQLETSPEAFAYAAALPQSLGVIATIRVRNQATLGGNLVHADPAQDPPPVLIALDATIDVVKAGGGARSIAMESFFTDYFETTIGDDELLRSVKVPPMPAGSRLAYKKFLPRTEDDYATVSVAVRLGVAPDGTCKDLRIGLGALAVTPLRGKAVEQALLGKKLTAESIREAAALVRDEVDPLDDVRGSAGYKREMARVWTERTIASLAGIELKAKAVKFDQTIDLPGVSPERVWAFVMDVPSMAKCIPGCEGVEDLGNNRYKAVVKIKVGPIGLSLASAISIVEKDEANRTAALLVEAADKRVGGAVKATMSMKLTPEGDGSKLEVSTDANVMGRIGDFGQPVIRKKADQTLQEVAANLRKALAA